METSHNHLSREEIPQRNVSGRPKFFDRHTLLHLAFLAALIWVVYYLHFRSLGLYEDDYAYISFPLGWHLPDLIHYLQVFTTWPQGRPLGFFIPHLLAFAGQKLGGLSTIYIFGYLVHAINAGLFYLILRKVSTKTIAFIGALTFVLFPADTTHVFLMHSLGLHTALTFLLIAAILYPTKWKPLSYLFGLASLVTYESPYLVFLAVPLLGRSWDRRLVREMLRHLAIWMGILIVVALIRARLGEGRIIAAESSLGTTLLHSLAAMGIGPAVSLYLFAYSLGWTLLHWTLQLTPVFAACLLPFAFLLIWTRRAVTGMKDTSIVRLNCKIFGLERSLTVTAPQAETLRLLLTGLVMLALAYGLSFTHFPPTALYGRVTSVHLAAAFGGSIVFSCLCSLGLDLAHSHRLEWPAVILLAVYLSGLSAYCFSIQLDFRQAWQNERSFWSQAVAELPDLTDGTIIFVLNHDLPTTRYILTNSWADPTILYQVYKFPVDWQTPPRLFVVGADWTQTIVRVGDQLEWQVPGATWQSHREVLPDGNVILLEMQNGRLVRRYGSLTIDGQELRLKSLPANASPDWPKGTLYPYLLGEK